MPIIHGRVTHSRIIKKTGAEIYYCEDHAPASAIRLQQTGPDGQLFSTYGLSCVRCLATQMRLIKQHRRGVCSGCRNNRYNFASGGDARNAPTIGDGCWSLNRIKAGVCPSKSR